MVGGKLWIVTLEVEYLHPFRMNPTMVTQGVVSYRVLSYRHSRWIEYQEQVRNLPSYASR